MVASLDLHKIKYHKIPKILNKCVDLMEKDLEKMSKKSILILYQAFKKLPVTFHPDFQSKLRKKILTFTPSNMGDYLHFINFWVFQE